MNGIRLSSPEKMTNVKEYWFSIVKGFEREEIEELLSKTFCEHCEDLLHARVLSIANRKCVGDMSISSADSTNSDNNPAKKNEAFKSLVNGNSRIQNRYIDKFSSTSSNNRHSTPSNGSKSASLLEDDLNSNEQKKKLRIANVGRKTNFTHYEKVNGKNINIVHGLELHTQVFNDEEQKKIVESVYEFQRMGQKGRLKKRTYSEPSKWMRGKGRVTIQFGCCYNYAVDKNGNPPGIIRDEEVDPLPPIFISMIKRMVRWHVLPPTCVPNSCIVNIYEEGDCIPPHIDHHDFLRPFCTISFLTECNILFGSNLKIIGPGEFSGPFSISLPVGSVLVLKGNGADVAKHCVPAVPAKRISITFRKMDESKIPYGYSPDSNLQGVRPLTITPHKSPSQQNQIEIKESSSSVLGPVPVHARVFSVSKPINQSLFDGEDDFPPLGAANGDQQSGNKKNVFKG